MTASAAAAVSVIRDGDTVGIGGSINAGAPMHLVRALLRSPARELTLVGGMTGTLALDFLIASGKVTRVVCPYIGNPEVSPVGPAFRLAAREGLLEIDETDEGVHLVALRAAAVGLPFGVWKASAGSSIPELNPRVRRVHGPHGAHLEVEPLHLDVALLWAPAATEHGDVVWWRVSLADSELAFAAAHRVLQVDRMVPVASLRETAAPVTPALADEVVVSGPGTWPFAGPGRDLDREFLREYAAATSLEQCRSFVAERIASGGPDD